MYKAITFAFLLFSMNLFAQDVPDRNSLFSSKTEFQEKLGWILNGKSPRFKNDSRSDALNTQADSIYFFYSFEGEEYYEPIRYYFTYENVAGEKRPTGFIYADGYDVQFNFRFELNYNDQGLNTGGNIYFDPFNSNQNVGYYEQRFDSNGNLIYHIVDIDIPDWGPEYYGDSLAITYNSENLESAVKVYTIDYDSGNWRITNDIFNMEYDNDSQLRSFEWHIYSSYDGQTEVSKTMYENIEWFKEYSFSFFSDIILSESIMDEISPEYLLPSIEQQHLSGPIQYTTHNFIDGEWMIGGSSSIDSISNNYLSIRISEALDERYALKLTLNDDGYILTQKFLVVDEEDNLIFVEGNEYEYNEFNLPVSQKILYSEDGSISEEYFTATYEIDDEQRLISFESETEMSFMEKTKGEYFYLSGVSTSSLQLQNDAVKLFPNPVDNKMTIQSELEIIKPMHYQIISPDGRTLMSGVFESGTPNEINVSTLTSGLYFFKWQMADKYGSQKVMKL